MRPYTLVLLFLTSCAMLTPTTPIDTKPALALPDPPPLKMRTVEFLVVHKDNAEKTFSDLEASGQDPVLFALTGTDYKNLAVNTIQIRNYVKNQRKIIRLYRKYYEGAQDGKGKN